MRTWLIQLLGIQLGKVKVLCCIVESDIHTQITLPIVVHHEGYRNELI